MQRLIKSWGRPAASDLKKPELFDRVKALVDVYTRHGFIPSAHALPSTDEQRALYEQHTRCWSKLEGDHALEWTAVDLSNAEVIPKRLAMRRSCLARSAVTVDLDFRYRLFVVWLKTSVILMFTCNDGHV